MKAKVLVLGVTCAAALAAVVLVRSERAPAPRPGLTAPRPDRANYPMLASYRVFEESRPEGPAFRGIGYAAELGAGGLRFSGGDVTVSLRAERVEQGGSVLELGQAGPARTRFGAAALDHGPVVEEFVFENRRVEQIVHVKEPLGEGALVVRSSIATSLGGPVTEHPRGRDGFREPELANGGLAFADASGRNRLYYHTAVAVDAAGRRCELSPRWEDGRAVLEVPASWMAAAAYPVAVDPFLQLDNSASGGGVSNTASVSDGPAMAIEGGGNPYVAWSDNSTGSNFEVFVRLWNGFEWRELAGSATTGISGNAGQSVNPSIALSPTGKPYVAWQDNDSGNLEIYCKRWDGAAWQPLGTSASGGGVSNNGGVSQNAQIAVTTVAVPFPLPASVKESAIVVWEDTSFASDILCRFFYPGDPGDPAAFIPIPPTPVGWYELAGSGTNLGLSGTLTGVSQAPSLAMTPAGLPVVAWQDSSSGNYEVYVARYTPPAGMPPFAVTGGGLVQPGGSWDSVGTTSNSAGGVSGTVGLSLNPSVAVDNSGAIFVAWQEDVSPTNTEIFLESSTGATTFADLDGSTAVDGINPLLSGISRTLTRSTNPSVGVSLGGTVVVAWQDEFNGNSEIHARRNFPASTTWEQIGAALSAAAYPAEAAGSNGGISNTANLSLAPAVKVDSNGDPVIAWMDGASGLFEVFLLRFFANAPLGLDQQTTLPSSIPVGATTSQTIVNLVGTVFTETLAGPPTVRLEVEVRPVGAAFTGADGIFSSSLQAGGTVVTIPVTGLTNGPYKWRARTVDDVGRASSWQSFGGNSDVNGVDFVVDTSAAPPGSTTPVVTGGASTESKHKCGLTGLEVLLALAGLGMLRRLTRRR